MIGSTTRRFTNRRQKVEVVTLSSLRELLESINDHECKFQVEKVSRDRVILGCEGTSEGKRVHSSVVLPAYPTGHSDDEPTNPNVVLDPLEFRNAESHEARDLFLPLFGHDVLVHFEKMHPKSGLKMTRCC